MGMIRRWRGEGSPWHRKKESEEMRKNTIPFRFRSHREFPSAWFINKFYTIAGFMKERIDLTNLRAGSFA